MPERGTTRHDAVEWAGLVGPRPRVLVVQGDREVAEEQAFHMRIAGLAPAVAVDGEDALVALERHARDAVIVDMATPRLNASRLIRRVRQAPSPPALIVATADRRESARIALLRAGVKHVLVPPVSTRELLVRLLAELRDRGAGMRRLGSRFASGQLLVDSELLLVSVAGQPVTLGPLEYRLLWTLIEERGRPVARDEIRRRVWGGARPPGSRAVDTLVSRLRRKLERRGAFSYVHTQPGVGYRFIATPRPSPRVGGPA